MNMLTSTYKWSNYIEAIIDDYRMQRIGGIVAAFEIWEMAVIPSLLNNSESWTEISSQTMEDLEDLQFLFIRTILETGKPTSRIALLWETGLLGMEERISKRKLEFIDHIKESDENTLVKKVFNEQLKQEWPGLIQECDKLCEDLELPKVSKNKLSKRDINKGP